MFTHDYLIFDELGLKAVLCMACGKEIKNRVESRSKLDSKLIVMDMAKHSDYREIPVILDDKRLAFLMVCDNCKFVEINEEEAGDISRQIKSGLRLQLQDEGKLPDLIEEILKERNYAVSRKAEVQEVTAALRGI